MTDQYKNIKESASEQETFPSWSSSSESFRTLIVRQLCRHDGDESTFLSQRDHLSTIREFPVISGVIAASPHGLVRLPMLARDLLNEQQPNAMLSRVLACCLAALVLAPFTAPFRTCDLDVLFGRTLSHNAPLTAPVSTTAMHEDSLVSLPVAAAPVRTRALPLATDPASVVGPTKPRMVARVSEPTGRTPDRAALTSVLRV
jgi:hypothetical protein